jgi:hypothetical protein
VCARDRLAAKQRIAATISQWFVVCWRVNIDWLITEIDNHIGDVGANALANVYEKPLTCAGIPAYIAMNSCVAQCFVIMPNYFCLQIIG